MRFNFSAILVIMYNCAVPAAKSQEWFFHRLFKAWLDYTSNAYPGKSTINKLFINRTHPTRDMSNYYSFPSSKEALLTDILVGIMPLYSSLEALHSVNNSVIDAIENSPTLYKADRAILLDGCQRNNDSTDEVAAFLARALLYTITHR